MGPEPLDRGEHRYLAVGGGSPLATSLSSASPRESVRFVDPDALGTDTYSWWRRDAEDPRAAERGRDRFDTADVSHCPLFSRIS